MAAKNVKCVITIIFMAHLKLVIGNNVDKNVMSIQDVCTGHSTGSMTIAISTTTAIIFTRMTLTAYQDITHVMHNDIINI